MNNTLKNRTLLSTVISSTLFSLCFFGCSSALTDNKDANSSSGEDAFAKEVVLSTLVDFDSAQQQSWVNAPTATALVKKSDNKSGLDDAGLNIEFLASENISQVTVKPNQSWQMEKFQDYNLAFDVTNEQDKSIQLYLSVENEAGEYQSRSISLAANFSGTIYFPLTGKEAETETGFWGDAPPWETEDQLMIWRSWRADNVNLDKVAALNFFTIGLLENKQIEIDNIRVRKNPESDPYWMKGIIDKFGQNAKLDSSMKINSLAQLNEVSAKELKELSESKGMPNRSKFGGYSAGPKLKATGYFRTQKVDGKWWMVDPEGYLYFSHGPANVRMANLSTLTGVDFKDDKVRIRYDYEVTPEDSMGIVEVSEEIKATRYISSPLRHNMFEWLPSYDDPLANNYSYRRSTLKGAVPHGETFSFYRANLERKYGEQYPNSFEDKWRDVTLERMKDWGFTSFGNWVDPMFYPAKQVPYFANGWIIGDFKTLSGKTNHWGLMPDPYDPFFAERARITIQDIAVKIKNSPWCVGIFIDNEKSWGEREGSVEARYGVIIDALSKDIQESPAKNAFMKHLQSKYKTIGKLNNSWNIQLDNWQDLAKGIDFTVFNENQIDDLSTMLEMLGEQYFIVVHNTLEEILPNHLYMGARMANWGMPDEIIKASTTYSDVLSFNIYEEGVQEHFWKFLEEVDLPVAIGEFHIGTATDSGMFNPGIVHASSQKDRAEMYKTYMESVLNKPYMVGAHWFQYVDEPISGRALDGENANIGFVDVTDTPYPELIKAVKDVTSTMYQNRYGK
ncbi:agarase [Colwellia echini]|uniref:Agarase n=2 Tax=Colwellia echini TaxID=1982103 RepID=A0ABY3N1Z5_9GAMM|nr:agarase [Colwellia echini]